MWTKDVPTQNGYFWWRIHESDQAEIVCHAVSKSGLVQIHGDNKIFTAKDLGGEWYSDPIKEPLDSAEKVCP